MKENEIYNIWIKKVLKGTSCTIVNSLHNENYTYFKIKHNGYYAREGGRSVNGFTEHIISDNLSELSGIGGRPKSLFLKEGKLLKSDKEYIYNHFKLEV